MPKCHSENYGPVSTNFLLYLIFMCLDFISTFPLCFRLSIQAPRQGEGLILQLFVND